MKKLLFVLIVFTFFFCGLIAFAQSEDDFEIRQNAQGGITITQYIGAATEVVIPRTIEGIRVTEIGQQAFSSSIYASTRRYHSDPLIRVVIPDTVTSIRQMAFAGNELTNIIIPSSVTDIGAMAFDPNPLTSITLPANLEFSIFAVSPFPNNLADFYTGQGRRAGTYTWSGRLWSRQ